MRSLNLTSDILISKVLEDTQALEELLYLISGEQVKIKKVQTQYSIRQIMNHSVILDVYAITTTGRIGHLEMQNKDNDDHLRRIRFCRGCIDTSLLDTGVSYAQLPDLLQIYIMRNDFIHSSQAISKSELPLFDGVREIFFNLQEKNGATEAQLALQQYFLDTSEKNEAVYFPCLVKRVHFLRENERGEVEMCEIFDQVREDGWQEGRKEGRQEGLNYGRREDICDLLQDLGPMSDEVYEQIQTQEDDMVLRRWVRLAARAKTVEEFCELS